MVIAPSSVDTNLSQLLLEASIGKIQLPEFQRGWTWYDDRIRGILASLSQGYPMGAIMRLQYGNPDIKFCYRTLEGVGATSEIPEYLILDEPTRGIDVGTKVDIQKLALKLASEGMSITFISSETDEMLRTCSRLIVMRDRKVVGELKGDDLTQSGIMKTIAGNTEENGGES